MDDYRDLVTAAFGLACAGFMLVAGQLYLEYGSRQAEVQQIGSPAEKAAPPAISSRKDAKSIAAG